MTTTTTERPECAGWHEADPICDGDPKTGEAACSYRSRCLSIVKLVGGPDVRTNLAVKRVLAEYDDKTLEEMAQEEAQEAPGAAEEIETGEDSREPEEPVSKLTAAPEDDPPEVPFTFPPILSTRGGKIMTGKVIHPRPTPRYDHVLPLVDALLERLARELGKTARAEGDPETRAGDLFIRWTPGMQGRTASIYEATDRGTMRHRLITRLIMLVREPRFNLKSNIPETAFVKAVSLNPPVGVDCRVWTDVKPHVALVGVDAHAVRDAARWLARCYKAGIVDDVKRKKTKRTSKKKPRKAIA